MAQALSSVIRLTDLNDFISPGQACIKPQPEKTTAGEKVSVSLADCLACSGCVTSAETVLINQQSHEELVNFLESQARQGMSVVASISHQAIASFAAKYHLPFQESAEKLCGFLKKTLGVDQVYDLTAARALSTIESAREFVKIWKNKDEAVDRLPLLNSVCPGWVCYIEKTHGSLVKHLSQVKSPQQIMGSLVKSKRVPAMKETPSPVYHVTVMPCFDKKLEASREYFINKETGEKDVDCVVTPIEIEQLLSMKNMTFNEADRCPLDSYDGEQVTKITSNGGSGSGGYAENVLKIVAGELFGVKIEEVTCSTRKNKDFLELTVDTSAGDVPLKFAIVNGFRNIQILVRMINSKKCPYQYVEVMACPGGCLNGGAQLKNQQLTEQPLLQDVISIYSLLELTPLPNISDETIDKEREESHLYTQFKAVPKTSNLFTTW